MLQAVLEVVDHRPLEVLDAARTPEKVALIGVQLQGVVGLHPHQPAQELRAVLEVDLCFGTHAYAQNVEPELNYSCEMEGKLTVGGPVNKQEVFVLQLGNLLQ